MPSKYTRVQYEINAGALNKGHRPRTTQGALPASSREGYSALQGWQSAKQNQQRDPTNPRPSNKTSTFTEDPNQSTRKKELVIQTLRTKSQPKAVQSSISQHIHLICIPSIIAAKHNKTRRQRSTSSKSKSTNISMEHQ
ncbi:hypothetical protein Nepgr_026679 [Nepenthes gracilis]|uniref:Uncharacterized protein n=1 Tax=Nepenthes gracilis TaxID=150966 RepID=A0AAD3T8Z3_NEPGR|nr:hypothetical protein Nepgr_026679 [Nepenthes gracilis]